MLVSVRKRLPIEEGEYYWLGKNRYGGIASYTFDEGFQFDDTIPVNKVDEHYLYWLDETNIKFEELENN